MSDPSFEDLNLTIYENAYIKNCKSNVKKDFNSLSYLVDKSLSQSDCIKLGIAVEKVFSDMILKYTHLVNIKPKNIKDKKEKDHLFMDVENKTIYYSELKANINLDTEKSKSTYKKCFSIVEELKLEYPDYKIVWCLLSHRYYDNCIIPKTILNKYSEVLENVFGVNQYFDLIGIKFNFSEETYKLLINNLANAAFD